MKSPLSRFLAVALCTTLVACGGNNEDNNGKNNVTPNNTTTSNNMTSNNTTMTNNTTSPDCSAVANACDAPGSSCAGDSAVVCAQDADGCLVETTTDCAANSQVCMGGACADPVECTDDAACTGLTDGARTCGGDVLTTCTMGADGCLDAATTDCAATGGSCDQDTQMCVTSCTDDAECAGLTDGGSACLDGGTTVMCAANADGCLEATTTACSAGETCDDSGASAVCVGACADALQVLSCADAGMTISGDTANGSSVLPENPCSPGDDYSGNEAIYVFSDSATNDVTVTVTYANAAITELDAMVTTGGACDDATNTCAGFDFLFGSDGELNFSAPANEAHYIVLEPYSPTTETTAFTISIACTPIVCGDGLIGNGEECDDGNTAGGDGCNAACEEEPGYVCDTSEPSACTPDVCGDSILSVNELCDDGNVNDGDGCDSSCNEEFGYECDANGTNCMLLPDLGTFAAGEAIANVTGGPLAAGEFDRYTITFSEAVQLSGTGVVGTMGDVDVYLLDTPTSAVLQEATFGDEAWTDAVVAPGTYELLAFAQADLDTYTITLSTTAIAATDKGTFAAGAAITDSTGGPLALGANDFYTITFSNDVVLSGTLTSDTGDADLLIRGSGSAIVTGSAADGDETFDLALLAGTYTLQVNSYSGAAAAIGTYTLSLSTVALTSTDIGTFAAGAAIADTVSTTLADGTSEYYTITFSTDVTLDVTLGGNTTGETGVFLYSADEFGAGSFEFGDEAFTADLVAAKYLIRVISNPGDGDVDSYTLGLTAN